MGAGEIVRIGYHVEQAENGGWVVMSHAAPYDARRIIGAFDDHESLLTYLRREHEVHAANRASAALETKEGRG